MIGGYETRKSGVCRFEGVKTRRFLNAPVSLDFKHRIGRSQDMPIKARYSVECNTTVVNGLLQHDLRVNVRRWSINTKSYRFIPPVNLSKADAHYDLLMNVELNHLADLAAKEAQTLINAACMREYNHERLHYFACNHNRYTLDSVNQNI